jgi:ABC-type multidrug transport system ATPase subunit
LDEPFNSLDTDTATNVIEIINTNNKNGKSTIIVTHNMSRIDTYCDKIFQLKDGLLIANEIAKDESTELVNYRLKFLNKDGMEAALLLLGDFTVKKHGIKSISIKTSRENLSVIIKRIADCSLVEFTEGE